MKNILTLSVVSAALFFTVPVYSMEVSADTIQTIQEYSGNARIVFKQSERFDISSDRTSKINGMTVFSGNVVVAFRGDYTENGLYYCEKTNRWYFPFRSKKILIGTC